MEVMSGPRCQEGYISFYINRDFFELNLNAFNSTFNFSPCLDLDRCYGPRKFNPNAFWYTITAKYQHDASHSKVTIIRNHCIGEA